MPAQICITSTRMLVTVFCLSLFFTAQPAFAQVTVARLTSENWATFVPKGKEVDAIYGDYVIQNKHVRAVIAMPKSTRNANMTVRNIGGCLIDFVDRQHESDQLSAFYAGKRLYRFRSWTVQVDGKTVDLTKQPSFTGKSASITVSAEATDSTPAVDVTYSLHPKFKFINITRKFKNESKKLIAVRLEDDLRVDGAKSFVDKEGNFTRSKEWIEKSSNGVHAVYTIQDAYWKQAYAFTSFEFIKGDIVQRTIQSNSNARTSSLRYLDKEKNNRVRIKPGESFAMSVQIHVGKNLVAMYPRLFPLMKSGPLDMPARETTIEVVDNQNQRLDAAIHFTDLERYTAEGEKTTTPIGWMTVSAKEPTPVVMLPFKYQVKVVVNGRQVLNDYRLPQNFGKTRGIVIKLKDYATGYVQGEFVDGKGKPLPCKVQFISADQTPTPQFAPSSAEFAVGNLRYAPKGVFRQALQAGKYKVIVSRGPEYDALFTEVTVEPGKAAVIKAALKRVVQTPGWVSCDFHSHSSPSGDNTGSQLGRVLNLVCEQIEFGPCTEHNRIDSYQSHIDRLGIGAYFSSVTGMELTGKPLPLNHQNTFPLKHKPHTQDGGGPVTDKNIETQIERLALWDNNSEKLIQQDHPDIGNLFYDKNGDGVLDKGFKFSIPYIDAMEIHPIFLEATIPKGKKFESRSHRVFNWLQILNQGHRITGVVNTDAHYNEHGSGGLRIWVKSPTDEPSKIKTLDIVHAVENRQVMMSNGPYLEVTAHHAVSNEFAPIVHVGSDLPAKSGFVNLHVKVQCPNWIDINHVVVLANGRPLKEFTFSRKTHPEKFGKGVIKFDQTLSLQLKKDTHLIVLATHTEKKLGELMGPFWGKHAPTAISNPIFVDVDGNGFQPNKDTLGHPLPVKRGTRKAQQKKPFNI